MQDLCVLPFFTHRNLAEYFLSLLRLREDWRTLVLGTRKRRTCGGSRIRGARSRACHRARQRAGRAGNATVRGPEPGRYAVAPGGWVGAGRRIVRGFLGRCGDWDGRPGSPRGDPPSRSGSASLLRRGRVRTGDDGGAPRFAMRKGFGPFGVWARCVFPDLTAPAPRHRRECDGVGAATEQSDASAIPELPGVGRGYAGRPSGRPGGRPLTRQVARAGSRLGSCVGFARSDALARWSVGAPPLFRAGAARLRRRQERPRPGARCLGLPRPRHLTPPSLSA